MAQNETWLSHDLMNPVKVQYLDGNLFSMDNAGNLIGVTLTKDGVAYSGGGSVSANVIRADGGTVAVSGALSDNVATVVLPQAAYAVPGVASIVVKLTVSGEITTIAAVVANVYESTTSTTIDPGTIIPSIQTLISQINTAVASIPADYSSLWTSLAPAFSDSTAYTAGQYVTYNGGLYRFVTDHAAGSWSSSDVISAKLGNDIANLKSALDIAYKLHEVPITETLKSINTSGSTVSMSGGVPQADTAYGYNYRLFDCEGYDYAVFTGQGGSTSRLFAFVDANGTILQKASQGATAVLQKEKVPESAKWFILNTKINTESVAYLYVAYDEQINGLDDEITAVENDLSDTFSAIKPNNVLVGTKCFDNVGMSSVDGSISDNTDYWITDFIDTNGASIVFSSLEIYKIVFFNTNKSFISYSTNNTKFTIPSNAKYIRLQYAHSVVLYIDRINADARLNISKFIYPYETNTDNVFVESSGYDIKEYADGVKLGYLDENNEITFSTNWRMYIFKVSAIEKISLVSCYTNLYVNQVAFYGAGGIVDSAYISGIPFDNVSTSPSQLKNIQIPSSAVYCVVMNRISSGEAQIIGHINSTKKPRSSNILGLALNNSGEILGDVRFWITDYISVDESKRKIISKYNFYKILYFDEEKTVTGYVRDNGGRFVNIPSGTVYFRIQYDISKADFYDDDNYLACVAQGKEQNPYIIFGTLNSYMADYSLKLALNEGVNSLSDYSGEKINIGNTCRYYALSYSGNYQDACWYNNTLFAFNSSGSCKVVNTVTGETLSTFTVDQYDTIKPHCNSAVFSNTFYDQDDDYPLIYINAYNTQGLPHGTCYVHRVLTDEDHIPTGTTLIQTIRVGFAYTEPWTDGNDIRPYGNFFVDTDDGYLYAYTLKDNISATRFFKFALPATTSSEVTLSVDDIVDQFDVPYMAYIQGNTYRSGKAYVLSGYGTAEYPGYLNVINLYTKQLVTRLNFSTTLGLSIEPEFINIHDGAVVTGQTTAYAIMF